MTRIGAVEFLNARPLVWGLDQASWCEVRFDVPSQCARLLHAGRIDLGLVPAIELLRGEVAYEIVPGPAIACRGAVSSVALFSRAPLASVRTIAVDTSSRSSAGLLRILCARHFDIVPQFVDAAPDLRDMLSRADAALLIGDAALTAPWQAMGLEKTDLGTAWLEMTGLPFVFAVWAARPGVLDQVVVDGLTEARDRGRAAIDEIARRYASGDAAQETLARTYLRDHIRYDLDADASRGLERYLSLAAELGLVPAGDLPAGVAAAAVRG